MRITTKQIDAIVPFLEVFEAEGFRGLESRHDDGTLQNCEQVRKFNQALYDYGWIVSVDWQAWHDQAVRYVDTPELVATADMETIRNLLITHARQDHFCEGHLGVMCQNGHIIALLRRLKELRATVVEEETKRRKASMERWRERSRHQSGDGIEEDSQHGESAKARAEGPMAPQERRELTDDDTSDGQKRLFPE